jgi:hypothetical protein
LEPDFEVRKRDPRPVPNPGATGGKCTRSATPRNGIPNAGLHRHERRIDRAGAAVSFHETLFRDPKQEQRRF